MSITTWVAPDDDNDDNDADNDDDDECFGVLMDLTLNENNADDWLR